MNQVLIGIQIARRFLIGTSRNIVNLLRNLFPAILSNVENFSRCSIRQRERNWIRYKGKISIFKTEVHSGSFNISKNSFKLWQFSRTEGTSEYYKNNSDSLLISLATEFLRNLFFRRVLTVYSVNNLLIHSMLFAKWLSGWSEVSYGKLQEPKCPFVSKQRYAGKGKRKWRTVERIEFRERCSPRRERISMLRRDGRT